MTATAEGVAVAARKEAVSAHPYRLLGSFRLFLAMLVLLSHTASYIHPALPPLALGNIGVLMFFVVSGFVICEACDVFYRRRIGNFLLNRALKIYPAYWAAVVLVYVIQRFVDVSALPDLTPARFDPWQLLVNATLLLEFLKSGNNLVVVTLTWAVLVECQFYFAAAFVFFAARRFRDPGPWLVAAAVGALALYVYVWATDSQHRFFGAFVHAPFFVFGSAFYFLLARRQAALWPLVAAAFLLALHAYLAYGETGAFHGRPWYWANGVPGPMMVSTALFLIAMGLFTALSQARASAGAEWIDKRLGDLTYAIYLVHQPFNVVAYGFGLNGMPAFGLVFSCSVASAFGIHRCVERPAMRLRNALRGVRLYD